MTRKTFNQGCLLQPGECNSALGLTCDKTKTCQCITSTVYYFDPNLGYCCKEFYFGLSRCKNLLNVFLDRKKVNGESCSGISGECSSAAGLSCVASTCQ